MAYSSPKCSKETYDSLSLDGTTFDYIICGGGTSGCLIAARLVALRGASVLLVEAGRDSGLAPDVLVPGKYIHQLSADEEGLWQLPTIPQAHLNGRELILLRGRQLGGSSAVNYMAMSRGPAADYNEWADRVGDDVWRWDNLLDLMRGLETFRPQPPAGYEVFAQARSEHHGTGGPISIGFGDVMVPGVHNFFQACFERGISIGPDNNGGNPVGVDLAQFNVGGGERSYAANAFLGEDQRESFENLTIVSKTSCDRVCFEGRKAVGVDLFHHDTGKQVHVNCNREIILTAGTFGSPQILMLSGIGPQEHLETLGIPVVANIPGCGKDMLDHSILSTEYRVDRSIPAHNQIFASADRLADAEAQYARDRTGPLSTFGSSGAVAFPRIEKMYQSAEFQTLDASTQAYLLEPTRPSTEIWLGSGPSAYTGKVHAEESYMTFELLLQNNLSRGTVSLRSNKPRDLQIIDPNFLSHPFDRRIAIETVREALRLGETDAYKDVIEEMVHGPEDVNDDDSILEFVRANLGQGYHSMGTCKMGRKDDEMRVVDSDFRVKAVQGLRVADLSVCPILTCNHTQINAYLIGEICARQLIGEFTTAKNEQENRPML